MFGGVASPFTVTVNVQLLRFVQSSVAVQVTCVVPMGNRLPDAGLQSTVTLREALSETVGAGHETGTGLVPQMDRVMFEGH